MKKIRIIGLGALGILFGHVLTKAYGKEQVSFIADLERMKRYKEEIYTWNGEVCDFSFIDNSVEEEADLVIVAVKSTSLDDALEVMKNQVGENTVIISVLNGLTSEEIIGNKFGMDKIIVSVAQGMDAVKTNTSLTFSKMGQVCMGIHTKEEHKKAQLEEIKKIFDVAGIPYTIEKDIIHRLWSKFMLNVGVNQVTTIYEGTYQTIQEEGEPRELMIGAMREVLTLAQSKGIPIMEGDLEEYVALVDTLAPEGMPSMRQDGLYKRITEVELFAGTVIKLGKELGIRTPINEMIYHKVKDMEARYERDKV